MPKTQLRPAPALSKPGFTYSTCGPFTKKRLYKNSKEQEIQDIFIKTNLVKLAFNKRYGLRRFSGFT